MWFVFTGVSVVAIDVEDRRTHRFSHISTITDIYDTWNKIKSILNFKKKNDLKQVPADAHVQLRSKTNLIVDDDVNGTASRIGFHRA